MPKFHLIKSGVVENTVLWDAMPPPGTYPGYSVIESTAGGPGWIWNGQDLASPPMPTLPVPAQITRLQLLLGLTAAGLITAAEGEDAAAGTQIPGLITAVFNTMPTDQAVAARIRWNAMTVCERSSPLVAAVAAASGKTPREMDDLFRTWSLL
jgi:hypothetical protein